MNYFNYFTEIEDAFVRRRGKHLFLSPMDWALMESWKQQEIPLHLVLRAIERAFDSFEARPRKRSVKSLLYCQEEVEAQFAEWLESRVGSNELSQAQQSDEPASHFSAAAIGKHLNEKKSALRLLANSNSSSNPEFSETLTRAADRLTELEDDLAVGGALNARRLEDSLTGVERMLSDALLSTFRAEVESITADLKMELQPYRSQMEKPAYEQMLNNLLMKRLREKFGIPRLSLFYL
ncbi:MAG TPA: hypothetical protein VL866_19785 [Pyrinomonadaceae bacterium]|nr:hypothetical protein [Pyrinomonadaceae bacterium]